MDIEVIYKVILFWVIFYITPGPVWISVMEATRNLTFYNIWIFFIQRFVPANLSVQVTQAVVCALFIDLVLKVFANVGTVFYVLGGLYILYLSYKVLKSQTAGKNLDLTFSNLSIIMIFSPKIWLLFPSGAVISSGISDSVGLNAFLFATGMFLISNLMFFLYAFIGKLATKLLKDNFVYISFLLLLIFAMFLFVEAFTTSW